MNVVSITSPWLPKREDVVKVYLHCDGGLGNQFFQYALGRALAIKTGSPLVIDAWDSMRGATRPLVLPKFKIRARVVNPAETVVCRVVDSKQLRRYGRPLSKWMPAVVPEVVRRREHGFDPAILNIRKTVYLEGFWQSELYFREFGEAIRAELQLREEPDETNRRWLEQIGSCESVGIHVRRGDYVSEERFFRRNGLCGLEYYRAAIEYVRQRVSSPVFFAFSDDPQWTRENLELPDPHHFVSHNCNVADWEDMRLMSACRHFIIANSTFSWWGAWLGRREGQIVVAPRRWFADATISEKDIVPEGWVRM